MVYYSEEFLLHMINENINEPVAPHFQIREKVKRNQSKGVCLFSPSWRHLWRSSCREQTSSGSGLRWCDSLRLSLLTVRETEKEYFKEITDTVETFSF